MNYLEFCKDHGLNPYHPEEWPWEYLELERRYRIAGLREWCQWFVRSGTADLIRHVLGNRRVVEEVLKAVHDYAPLRHRRWSPYGRCPCHPLRLGTTLEGQNPWDNRFVYSGSRTERALSWLKNTFGNGVEEHKGDERRV